MVRERFEEVMNSLLVYGKLNGFDRVTCDWKNEVGQYIYVYGELEVSVVAGCKQGVVTYIRSEMSDTIHVGEMGYAKDIWDRIYVNKEEDFEKALEKISSWVYEEEI